MLSEKDKIKLSFNFKNELRDFIISKALEQSLDASFLNDAKCPPACPKCCTQLSKKMIDFGPLEELSYELLDNNELSSKLSGLSLTDAASVMEYSIKRLIINHNPSNGLENMNEVVMNDSWFFDCPFYYGKCVIHEYKLRPELCKQYHCGMKVDNPKEDLEVIYSFFNKHVLPGLINLSERAEIINDWESILKWAKGLKETELRDYLRM